MNTKSININIWDDYYDDDCVPDGEIQETYAYVESELEPDECKIVLESFKKVIEPLVKPEWNLEMQLHFYDSAKVYPNLVGTAHEYCLYKRWELQFKNLTHQAREYLVETLENQDFKYQDIPITVYSES